MEKLIQEQHVSEKAFLANFPEFRSKYNQFITDGDEWMCLDMGLPPTLDELYHQKSWRTAFLSLNKDGTIEFTHYSFTRQNPLHQKPDILLTIHRRRRKIKHGVSQLGRIFVSGWFRDPRKKRL